MRPVLRRRRGNDRLLRLGRTVRDRFARMAGSGASSAFRRRTGSTLLARWDSRGRAPRRRPPDASRRSTTDTTTPSSLLALLSRCRTEHSCAESSSMSIAALTTAMAPTSRCARSAQGPRSAWTTRLTHLGRNHTRWQRTEARTTTGVCRGRHPTSVPPISWNFDYTAVFGRWRERHRQRRRGVGHGLLRRHERVPMMGRLRQQDCERIAVCPRVSLLAPSGRGGDFRDRPRLNRRGGVSSRVVEQSATAALEYAHHGYLLESVRVPSDGPATLHGLWCANGRRSLVAPLKSNYNRAPLDSHAGVDRLTMRPSR